MGNPPKAIPFEPTHDIYHYAGNPLDKIFAPKSVALIGATEKHGTVGRTILWNLISSPFGGTIYPINPNRPSVLGIKAYPNISAAPEQVDLAVICTPAPSVPNLIKECVDQGVPGAIVISAGFKEVGPEGAALEAQIMDYAHQGNLRIIGPNCLGVMNPHNGLNATFAADIARPGNVGFISQSGALCTAVLDWSYRENVGFSAFVSIGSMLDVGWGDLIDYLGNDPRTQSIVIYMETIGDARSFLSAAREVALTKPIIVIKPGRTAGAAKAAASHTGSLTGSDDVLEAAFRRSGVLRVNDISDLFNMAETLAHQPRPKGPRLTIVTNAGGPGVLATDSLIMSGGELSEISPETMQMLNGFLPGAWSHNNPIDVLGDASPDRYAQALEIAAADPNSDGLLVILTPQAMTEPTKTAEALMPYAHRAGKPVLASWMGGENVEQGLRLLGQAGVPTFQYPDTATRVFAYMWKSAYNLQSIYETPSLSGTIAPDRAKAEEMIQAVRESGRTILTEVESKQLLAAYGLPIVETVVARTEAEAVSAADAIGYPVVLKIYSETITHKTDVGGVQLNLKNSDAVRTAYRLIETAVREKVGAQHFQGVSVQPMIKLDGYEVIIGASIDLQFGPVLLFGSGGQLVEIYKDRALALPPLTSTLARRMMEHTTIYKALQGVRGRQPADLEALAQLLVRFSELVVEQRWIKEIDINPLLVTPLQTSPRARGEAGGGLIALDARVVVHDRHITPDQLPRLAIRPYPLKYVRPWTTPNGEAVTIRPIRPEDEPLLVKFHETLSDRSIYLRYLKDFEYSERVAHERLARLCFIDYDREMALVAECQDCNGGPEIMGIARLSRHHVRPEGKFTMLINDRFQGRGIGTELLSQLIDVARGENLARVTAEMTADNLPMQQTCKKLGFKLFHAEQGAMVNAVIEL